MAVEKCACGGDYLERFLQPVILSILTGGPCSGYAVLKRIPDYATFTSGSPDPTGVYRYLKILVDRGLIRKDDDDHYEITEPGRACLARWVDTLTKYTETIQILTSEIRKGNNGPDGRE